MRRIGTLVGGLGAHLQRKMDKTPMRVPYLSKPTETQHTNQRKQASNQRKQALPLRPARIGGTVRLNGLASQGGWRPSFRTTDTQEAEGTPPRGSSIRRALDGARRFEGRVLSKFRRAVLDHPEGGDVLNHPETKKTNNKTNTRKPENRASVVLLASL